MIQETPKVNRKLIKRLKIKKARPVSNKLGKKEFYSPERD